LRRKRGEGATSVPQASLTGNNDRLRMMILCRIAHITLKLSAYQTRSEQFRPAIDESLSDDQPRDEHFFSLFQVL